AHHGRECDFGRSLSLGSLATGRGGLCVAAQTRDGDQRPTWFFRVIYAIPRNHRGASHRKTLPSEDDLVGALGLDDLCHGYGGWDSDGALCLRARARVAERNGPYPCGFRSEYSRSIAHGTPPFARRDWCGV